MNFRKATTDDLGAIWQIILYAKSVRKAEGSTQWQDGYPNEHTLQNDIAQGWGYVFTLNNIVISYVAIILGVEPAYEAIEGRWLGDAPYIVVHRMAVAAQHKGKKMGQLMIQKAEAIALGYQAKSVRIDTNYDNQPMLNILQKQGYTYCGEVYFRGSLRKAFEKILQPNVPSV